MNDRRTDYQLLREFLRCWDQRAFAAVVARYLNLVYGTACRKIHDQAGAQEVARNVFCILARKAWQFAPDDSVSAWLHRTTLLEAKSWLRAEMRHGQRERTAAELGTVMKALDDQAALSELVPMLDDALLSLPERDRTALLLRFYQNHPLREVGASLGVGEGAAQKRVAHALDRVAEFFKRRGFKTATRGLAATILEQTATSAPATAAAAVTTATVHVAPPAMMGLAPLLSRLAGLNRMQTATLCVVIAATPMAWQWREARSQEKELAAMRATFKAAQEQEGMWSAEVANQREEAQRLDSAMTATQGRQVAEQQTRQQWDALAARTRDLLNGSNYQWPSNLPMCESRNRFLTR